MREVVVVGEEGRGDFGPGVGGGEEFEVGEEEGEAVFGGAVGFPEAGDEAGEAQGGFGG